MRKLLLAGALVLAVACQKETIEEQANDFANVAEKTSITHKGGEGATEWDLGEGFNSNMYGYSGSTYITSMHNITTDNVPMVVQVQIVNPYDTDYFELHGLYIQTGEGVEPNYNKSTFIPNNCNSNDCEFSFNTDTGEFVFNGPINWNGTFKVEFKGKVLDMDSKLRSLNYRQINSGDVFSLSINEFTASAPAAYGFDPIHTENNIFPIDIFTPVLMYPGPSQYYTYVSNSVYPDYYVEFTANNFSEETDYIKKFRLYYLRSGELIRATYYRRWGDNTYSWNASQLGSTDVGTYSFLIANIASILTLF